MYPQPSTLNSIQIPPTFLILQIFSSRQIYLHIRFLVQVASPSFASYLLLCIFNRILSIPPQSQRRWPTRIQENLYKVRLITWLTQSLQN